MILILWSHRHLFNKARPWRKHNSIKTRRGLDFFSNKKTNISSSRQSSHKPLKIDSSLGLFPQPIRSFTHIFHKFRFRCYDIFLCNYRIHLFPRFSQSWRAGRRSLGRWSWPLPTTAPPQHDQSSGRPQQPLPQPEPQHPPRAQLQPEAVHPPRAQPLPEPQPEPQPEHQKGSTRCQTWPAGTAARVRVRERAREQGRSHHGNCGI